MCATCVTQGAPYVLGAVVALRAMGSASRRRADRSPTSSESAEPEAAERVSASAGHH